MSGCERVQEGPRVGWCCAYTPEEILEAAGFSPYRLEGSTSPHRSAGAYFPADFCSYVRGLAESVLGGEGGGLAGAVIANSCQPMLHFYNFWRRNNSPGFIFLLDVPRRATEEAARYYAHNLRVLWKELKNRSGVVADEEDLWRVIAEYRRTRELLARLSALSWRQPPVLAGSRVAEMVRMAARSPKREFNRWLASNLAVLEGDGEKNSLGAGHPSGRTGASASARGPRLLVTGSVAPPGLIDRLEKLGAQIVADDLCTGARYWWRPTEDRTQGADGSDPFLFLARSYLRRLPCPRMIGDGWRWQSLVERIKEYRIDGVVFYNTKFCDFYHYALPVLRNRLRSAGTPLLRLEGEYFFPGGIGQLTTRVQAFLESLEVRSGVTGCAACGG